MESVIQDLRYGMRMLWKNRSFTLIAIITLALGIGANSAVFSVINSVLLRPLPYKEPSRLVLLKNMSIFSGKELHTDNLLAWKDQARSFESLTTYGDIGNGVNLTGITEPTRVEATDVMINFFPTLGVNPALGRFFLDSESNGQSRVAVIGYKLWKRHFNGDPNIINKTVLLNGKDFTIVGVAPNGFQYPHEVELWIPITFEDRVFTAQAMHFEIMGRLRSGAGVMQAQQEMNAIIDSLTASDPEFKMFRPLEVTLLMEETVKDIRLTLLVLFGTVGFVLLIACANVTNLLLARAAARQKELAIRAALGASRLRLIRQLLIESLTLSLLGGGLGLLIALWGVDLLVALSPASIPRVHEIRLDGQVFGFTLLVSLVTGIIFGLLPALQASKVDLRESLKSERRTTRLGFGMRNVRSGLVVAEVAMAFVLLVGAGLLIKSFIRLQQVELGFNPHNLLTISLDLPDSKYKSATEKLAFFQTTIERLQSLPGVEKIGAINSLPLSNAPSFGRPFAKEGQAEKEVSREQFAMHYVVNNDYLTTMQIPLKAGRIFQSQDNNGSTQVVVISQAMKDSYWPMENPIGKRITILGEKTPREIIGVVGDIKQWGSESTKLQNVMYVSYIQNRSMPESLLIRTAGDPMSLLTAVRKEIQAIDKELPLYDIKTMEMRLSNTYAKRRFILLLIGVFATVALSLATIGIYGVMTYSVMQRTHEIGVRMALGAQQSDVLRLILTNGVIITLAGIVIGLLSSLALTRLINSLLFGISPNDPITFTIIAFIFATVALLACFLPARRAALVDPMVVLRYE